MIASMASNTASETLLVPQKGSRPTASAGGTSALSTQILKQSASRLRVLALLYAFTFFMAGVVPSLVSEMDRGHMIAHFEHFIPAVVGIVGGLAVAGFTLSERVPL